MNIKKLFSFRLDLNPALALLLIFFAALFTTLLMFMLQPDGIGDILSYFTNSNGIILLLNLWPIFFFMTIIFLLSNSLSASVTPIFFIALACSVINRYKIDLRQSPFLPFDFFLIRELLGISKSLNLAPIIAGLIAAVVLIVIAVLILNIFRVRKIRSRFRLSFAVALAAAFFLINSAVYTKYAIYESFYINGNIQNKVALYNSRGFLYSFIHELNHISLTAPANYDEQTVEAYINEQTSAAKLLPPVSDNEKMNVIMIMGEAFSDIGDTPLIDYSGYTDPLLNYKRLREDSFHGHIVTPNLGGGTSDTEFDALTGLATRYLRSVPYSYDLVTHSMDSLASFFNGLGYTTSAVHPGNSWFYNRANVYEYFGFQSETFIEDFDEYTSKAGYPVEEIAIDKIIEEIESKGDKPIFNFTVTIQNHGPYIGKYGAETNFSTSLPLAEDETNALSNYFVGLSDVDRELGRLCSYLNEQQEPYVLLYFGDHLPSFPEPLYAALLDVPINSENLNDRIKLYEAPFMFWQNSAAKANGLAVRNFEAMGIENDRVVSSEYLPALLLKFIGLDGRWPLMDFNYNLMKDYPVVLEKWTINKEGAVSDSPLDETNNLNFYNQWIYYLVTH